MVSVLEVRKPDSTVPHVEGSRESGISFSALTRAAQYIIPDQLQFIGELYCEEWHCRALLPSVLHTAELQTSMALRAGGGTATGLGAITIIYSE